uniref:Antichymotrypsin-2 n=1 Tax=Bombyx mori TaxID=7091 RepID=ACH2_BOMMO|nr:RecName: Full=Antichymotrypsin-2; AltName: Full=Antichymotrypsin II; Short=ACHY-II [Bombyx mori]AAB20776.1 antichymotrypsin II, sw-AchyII=serpin (serine proteinase inhibitor) [Bombyx mori=silkworms, larval hemolymph, Peptide, 375 aa] [Bombyx mori]
AVTNLSNVLKNGNDNFTARMFTEVVKNNPGKSIVLSAFSVLPPLAQLALASDGETHEELLKAIGFPDDDAIRTEFASKSRDLRSIKGVELKMANKVYVHDGGKLDENFAVVSRDVFNSDVQNIDFSKNTVAAKSINDWVEENTNNRIKDLVNPDSLSSATAAVLVNAIYFKGAWSSKFDERLTSDRDFYVSKDKTIKVPMMYKRGDYKYGESAVLNAQLIEIPYKGDQSSLIVVLPKDKDGITQLQEALKDPKTLETAQQSMYSTEVDLYLPKFKIETETNLKDVLSNMNVNKIFNNDAQITRLLKGESLSVSEAIQKAFIEINEEGAEAAAANAFAVVFMSAVVSQPLVFKANHPFVFFLKGDGVTLFNGVFHP